MPAVPPGDPGGESGRYRLGGERSIADNPGMMGGQERTGGVPLARATSGRWLGGVCAGPAPIRGLGVGWLRFGFVLLALLGGLGIAFYLACWLIIPVAGSSADE